VSRSKPARRSRNGSRASSTTWIKSMARRHRRKRRRAGSLLCGLDHGPS
jgi:hypothetical protein